jgi:hypothetical protein
MLPLARTPPTQRLLRRQRQPLFMGQPLPLPLLSSKRFLQLLLRATRLSPRRLGVAPSRLQVLP